MLTVYAISVENLERPEVETRWLLRLVAEVLRSDRKALIENGVRLRFIGELEMLPPELQRVLQTAESHGPAEDSERLLMCIALSYSGRHEVARVAKALAERVSAGELRAEELDEAAFSDALRSSPRCAPSDPDFLIRTGGQQRLSNFLLYQAAYTELYVTDTLWPDFGAEQLCDALQRFAGRRRTFGRRL